MADNIYTVNPTSIQDIAQYEKYSAEDVNLIESFEINSTFNTQKHISELHIYTTGNTLLRSITNYSRYKIEQGSGASTEGSTSISLDPQQDAVFYGYENGGVKLLYIFFNNLFSDLKLGPKLYIKEISNDRTELKLSSTGILSEDLKKYALEVKKRIEDTSYFSEFRLNFGNNDLFIGINIDFNDEEQVVTIKLYEPLPTRFTLKSTLDIVEFVSNPLAYEVEAEFVPDAPRVPRLREANFNVDLEDNTAVPSQFFNYDELFSFDVSNTNYQVLSLFNERGAQISIDHTDYSDFIHFSSAEERLINFKYKLDLIKNYETSINNIRTPQGSSGITNNTTYYQDLIKGIVDNFDHYERYLYFESGSSAWPKSNSNKPYVNQASSTTEAITWFANQRTIANNYDVSNFNALTNTIPAFIREDDNNAQYVLFIQMLAQHFDNLYIYAKAVSDKYDADNRVNVGVSRDLVEEAVKSLGVKLYNSSKSLDDLFKYFVGEFQLDSGEVVGTNVQAGQLKSGGTTVVGIDNGFIGTSVNPSYVNDFYGEGSSAFFTGFGSNTLQILYQQSINSNSYTSFSDEYTGTEGNLGSVAYITLIDTSTDTTLLSNAKYKVRDDIPSLFKLNQGEASIRMNGVSQDSGFFLHYTDDDGTDHSELFASVDSSTTLKIEIRSSKVISEPVVQEDYQPTAQDIYQKSVYKRIYHNLPFLLKTKGTQRGLRALINCFGIPSSILKIKTYGGRDTSKRPFFGDSQYRSKDISKVRTDNTGSIIEGDTLSRYTSAIKTDDSYNQDLHNVEVGFSPSDNLDSLINDTLGLDFNIDDYIGDPRDQTSNSYTGLSSITKTALSSITEKYDIKDFIRLIKFFDNVIFKMIKDFVPARSTTDTGVIIKPHLLDRSKIKSISATASQPEYSGSIDTAFITGSNGGVYKSSASGSLRFDSESAKILADFVKGTPGESSTRQVGFYRNRIKTPLNISQIKQWKSYTDHGQEESKFDGELKNSKIVVSTGELNDENTLKQIRYPFIGYDVFLYIEPPVNICLFSDSSDTVVISIPSTELSSPYIINIEPDIFEQASANSRYYEDLEFDEDGNPTNLDAAVEYDEQLTVTHDSDTDYPQYEEFNIVGYDSILPSDDLALNTCATERTFTIVRCRLAKGNIPSTINIATPYNLTDWFTGRETNTQWTIKVDGSEVNPTGYIFSAGSHTVSIEDNVDSENCSAVHQITVGTCPIVPKTVIKTGEAPDHTYNVPSYFNKPTGLQGIKYAIRFEYNGTPYTDLQGKLRTGYTVLDNEGYIQIPAADLTDLPANGQTLKERIFLSQFVDGITITAEGVITPVNRVKFKAKLSEDCQPTTATDELDLYDVYEERIFSAEVTYSPDECTACGLTDTGNYNDTFYLYYRKSVKVEVGDTYDINTDVVVGSLQDFSFDLDNNIGLFKTQQAAIDELYDLEEFGTYNPVDGWYGDVDNSYSSAYYITGGSIDTSVDGQGNTVPIFIDCYDQCYS